MSKRKKATPATDLDPVGPRRDTAPPSPPASQARIPVIAWVVFALAFYLVAEFPQALRVPFYGDDFLFLKKTRDASFLSLWQLQDLAFNYYRPWSREFQYWIQQRLFGIQELPFHVVAFGLWLAILGTYFALARHLVGTAAAAISTTGMAALAAWGAVLMWIAGLQELWMLAFALGSLLAFVHRRLFLATLLFVLALLSKETAAMLPAIALGYGLVVERQSLRVALGRTAPLWLITIVWAVFHPHLGGRLLHPFPEVAVASHPPPATILARAVLATFNLDESPNPQIGWPSTLKYAIAGIAPLGLLLAWVLLGRRERSRRSRTSAGFGRIIGFGALWMVLGWIPMLLPTIPWIAYYALLGTFGAWLVLGLMLARWPHVALAVVCGLVVVRVARATTNSTSWGSEWYHARASMFMLSSRESFKAQYPQFPPHSRIYLSRVPGAVGLIPGGEESIVMQVWYADTTLRTFFGSRFRSRQPGEPAGQDYFFTYQSGKGWQEDQEIALPDRPTAEQREEYAARSFKLRSFNETLSQYKRLVEEHPDRVDYVFNVGSCYYQMGDSVEAARWYHRAASFPNAPPQMKRAAERLSRFLPPDEVPPP